jgi:PAS domain-containing protein
LIILPKVEKYTRELGSMLSSMSYISSHFTSTTATSPLGLPSEVSNALRTNTKYCLKTALPVFDKLYQDAKSTVEERLARELYPDFVKYQFSQCLTASLAADGTLTGEYRTRYPGLGEAFCLTDPLEPDNPIVYASDGLLEMCGFQRKDLVGKNSRVLQGVATDPGAAHRLSEAIAASREFTELLINYTPDQTPYWNFLSICPLMENGIVRFFLGAQVNVSENMSPEYKDMEDVLKFGPPPAGSEPARVPASPTPPSQPPRRDSPTSESAQSTEQPTENPTSRRFHFFRRFHRKPSSTRTSSPAPTALSAGATPSRPRGYFSPHMAIPRPKDQSQRLDEFSTPYSRHFVMRFSPTAPNRRGPRLTRGRDRDPPGLPIAFCSTFALTSLGIRQDESHTVLNRDIFEVLSTRLGSPSLTRSFRKSVMGKLAAGESVHVDVMVPAEPAGGGRGRARSASRGSSRSVGPPSSTVPTPPVPPLPGQPPKAGPSKPPETAPPPSAKTGTPRPSGTIERGAELFSQVLRDGHGKSDHGKSGHGKRLRRVVTSWVPLKDVEGVVGFVILVLTPGDTAGASE